MQHDALKLIHNTALAAESGINDVLAEHNLLAIPDGFKVHDLQQYQDNRRRFVGKFCTQSLADYVTYVKRNAGPKSEGFIDGDKLTATAIFNHGDVVEAGHCDWTGVLTMKQTAAYVALIGANGARFDQQDLIAWLEDWSQHLTPYRQAPAFNETRDIADSGYGSLAKALAAIRAITIKATSESENKVGDFSAARTSLDEVEARSKHELPGGFTFECEPYLGLSRRAFDLRLSLLTSKQEPTLILRVQQLEAQKEAIAQDFKATLLREIGDACRMTIGTFAP